MLTPGGCASPPPPCPEAWVSSLLLLLLLLLLLPSCASVHAVNAAWSSCCRLRPVHAADAAAPGHRCACSQLQHPPRAALPSPPPPDAYLYAEQAGWASGDDAFEKQDHVRFASRVKSVGHDYIVLERPLTYDLRLWWKVRCHSRRVMDAARTGRGGAGHCMQEPWQGTLAGAHPPGKSITGCCCCRCCPPATPAAHGLPVCAFHSAQRLRKLHYVLQAR